MMNPEMNHQNISKYINTFFMKQMLVTIDFQTIYYNIHTVYTFESLLKMRDSGTDLFCGFCKVAKRPILWNICKQLLLKTEASRVTTPRQKKLFFDAEELAF